MGLHVSQLERSRWYLQLLDRALEALQPGDSVELALAVADEAVNLQPIPPMSEAGKVLTILDDAIRALEPGEEARAAVAPLLPAPTASRAAAVAPAPSPAPRTGPRPAKGDKRWLDVLAAQCRELLGPTTPETR